MTIEDFGLAPQYDVPGDGSTKLVAYQSPVDGCQVVGTGEYDHTSNLWSAYHGDTRGRTFQHRDLLWWAELPGIIGDHHKQNSLNFLPFGRAESLVDTITNQRAQLNALQAKYDTLLHQQGNPEHDLGYQVFGPLGSTPQVVHANLAAADCEAARLVEKHNAEALVLKIVGVWKPRVVAERQTTPQQGTP